MSKVETIRDFYRIDILCRLGLWVFLITLNLPSVANDSLRIEHFTLEDGLSQVTVNDLLKDQEGFVWIGTQDGLNRFDGEEFHHYLFDKADTNSISGNFISSLYQEQSGNIWIGTIGNGVNYYDRRKDRFQRIKLENSESENENISDLTQDHTNSIWVASLISGLHRLKQGENGFLSQETYFPGLPLSALNFVSIDNQLLVGSTDGQVFILDVSDMDTNSVQPVFEVEGEIRAFYNIGDQILVGGNEGLFIYNKITKELEKHELNVFGGQPGKYISSFLKGGQSTVWIGTGDGAYLFDWSEGIVKSKISDTKGNSTGLSNNTVESMARYSDDQILIGTGKDLNIVDFSSPYFKNISKDEKGQRLLNDNVVFSVLRDGDDLWVGTSEGGLNLIRNGRPYYFKDQVYGAPSISGSVRSLVKDSAQRLWVATTRGLGMIDLIDFNPENPEFVFYYSDPESTNSINSNDIMDLVLDENQNLWGATYGNGIFCLNVDDSNQSQITRYLKEPDESNTLPNNYVNCITVDHHNNIWVGTDKGLSKLVFKNGGMKDPDFVNYYKVSEMDSSLSNNSVYDILVDKKDRVWVGTQNGFNLHLAGNKFKSWTDEEQFPNPVIYSIQDDEGGFLWLGTNEGVVRFDPESNSFTQYGEEDGIQSREFDIQAKYRDRHGNIYLGGINGITYFHPDNLVNIEHAAPLYFSQLKVKDQVIKPASESDHLLKYSLRQTRGLNFRYDQFPFYLRFSTIDFRLYKNVQFGYKLLPLDKNWNMLSEPEVQFLNLPAGEYILQVNGFSRGKEWNQPLEMKLNIFPPWWKSWWAYIIYACAIGSLAWWFYRFQLSRKLALAESIRLREINNLKTNLYTNITHEFRTPLTVIQGMAKTLKGKKKKSREPDTEAEPLEMIERNSEKLLRLVNEMLDLAKLENGSLKLEYNHGDVIPFVRYVSESFHSLAVDSRLQLTVYSEIDNLTMDFDADKLSAIISNLLSNAIKFTDSGGKIIVHLNRIQQRRKEWFIIKIKDNGKGIPEDSLPHVFDRFYQVEASSSKRGEGTGIGLALTKELAELMGGSIEVRSASGEGSEFTVSLPVHHVGIENKKSFPGNSNTIYGVKTPSILAAQEISVQVKEQNIEGTALVIEDNIDVAQYLKMCLDEKYKILHAVNGQSGVDKAFESIPDIIISDVMMPEMGGYEVCSILKSDTRTDHIPIIMLTAKATVEDRLAGLSRGADAYLTKPFMKAELFTRMDQLIQLRKKMIEKFEGEGFTKILNNHSSDPETLFIQKAIKAINNKIENEKFNSAYLAREVNLSESQLYRKLKAITGKSTAVFIRSVRLEKARELILSTDKNISEVAYETGFNDPAWFSRAFKKEFGYAPSELRK